MFQLHRVCTHPLALSSGDAQDGGLCSWWQERRKAAGVGSRCGMWQSLWYVTGLRPGHTRNRTAKWMWYCVRPGFGLKSGISCVIRLPEHITEISGLLILSRGIFGSYSKILSPLADLFAPVDLKPSSSQWSNPSRFVRIVGKRKPLYYRGWCRLLSHNKNLTKQSFSWTRWLDSQALTASQLGLHKAMVLTQLNVEVFSL